MGRDREPKTLQNQGLSHGVAWKMQKVLWALLFIPVVAWLSVASYRPTVIISKPALSMGVVGLICLTLLLNLGIGLFHYYVSHGRRAAHTGVVTGVNILFLLITAAVVFIAGSSLLSGSVVELAQQIENSGLLLSVLPYLLWFNALLVGLGSASFLYENLGKAALLIPAIVVLMFVGLFGHHYLETSSNMGELKSEPISQPYKSAFGGFEDSIGSTRLQAPPMNKLSVIAGVVSHVTVVYSDLKHVAVNGYRLTDECGLNSDTESLKNFMDFWRVYLHVTSNQYELMEKAKILSCNPSCPYESEQIRESLGQSIRLEQKRFNAARDILNLPERDKDLKGCRLEKT